MKYTLLLSVVLTLGLTACGSEEDENDKPLTSSQPFTATADCPTGGVEISVGNDSNENNILDAGEITSTERLCSNQLASPAFYACGDTTCRIFGRIKQNFTMTADKTWIMTENVIVGEGDSFLISEQEVADISANGFTLTIEPGTEILAFKDTELIITRGSKIMAEGTREAPIIFKSYAKDESWFGISLHGFAPVYPEDIREYDSETQSSHLIESGACGSEVIPCNMLTSLQSDKPYYYPGSSTRSNSDALYYGGSQIKDNSGILSYVQLQNRSRYKYSHTTSLRLYGVGNTTTINNIGIILFDGGIEINGGSTNIENIIHTDKHEVLTFDIQKGFKGNIANVISYLPDGDIEIRAKGNDTKVSLSNVLFSTDGAQASISSEEDAVVRVYNSILYTEPADNCLSDDIEYSNVLSSCMDSDLRSQVIGNYPLLTETGALDNQPTLNTATPIPVDNDTGFSFKPSNHIGIMPPNSTLNDAWWHGWSKEIDETISLKTSSLVSKRLGMPDFIRCDKEISTCEFVSDIYRDFTIESSYSVSLDKNIKVGNNNQESDSIEKPITLTIEAGSSIKRHHNLIITRNAKIIAQGTPEKPIKFNNTNLIILGKAPVYNSDHCDPESKSCSIHQSYISNPGKYNETSHQDQEKIIHYGGNQPDDSSGTISHIKFIYSGQRPYPYTLSLYTYPLALMGVGHGTQANNIEIYNATERDNSSGVRITGGTVNIRNVVDFNSSGLTFSNGYKGNIQNLISLYTQPPRHYSYFTKHSFIHIEDPSGKGNTPTQVAIGNYLAISTYEGLQGHNQTSPIMTENYSDLRLYNSALSNKHTDAACIEVPSPSDETSLNITLTNLMDDCRVGLFAGGRTADSQTGVTDLSAAGLALSINAAGVATNSDITAIDLVEIDNGSSFEFENTDYMGAVKPGTSLEDAWWYGWTEAETAEAFSNL